MNDKSANAQDIRFSGLVVTLNEEKYLSACLRSLSFCDEIIVIDLGSTDKSRIIAKQHGARVLLHEQVPHVQLVRDWGMAQAKNDWIAILDPDEILPKQVEIFVRNTIIKHKELAALRIRFEYYFYRRKLTVTKWSLGWNAPRFCHRHRIDHPKLVHQGIKPKKGYLVLNAWDNGYDDTIAHYWNDSLLQLVKAHNRYLRSQGEAQYSLGKRFWWSGAIKATMHDFYNNAIVCRGLRNVDGIFLSLFSAWYTFMCWMMLRRYEKQHAAGRNI